MHCLRNSSVALGAFPSCIPCCRSHHRPHLVMDDLINLLSHSLCLRRGINFPILSLRQEKDNGANQDYWLCDGEDTGTSKHLHLLGELKLGEPDRVLDINSEVFCAGKKWFPGRERFVPH